MGCGLKTDLTQVKLYEYKLILILWTHVDLCAGSISPKANKKSRKWKWNRGKWNLSGVVLSEEQCCLWLLLWCKCSIFWSSVFPWKKSSKPLSHKKLVLTVFSEHRTTRNQNQWSFTPAGKLHPLSFDWCMWVKCDRIQEPSQCSLFWHFWPYNHSTKSRGTISFATRLEPI